MVSCMSCMSCMSMIGAIRIDGITADLVISESDFSENEVVNNDGGMLFK